MNQAFYREVQIFSIIALLSAFVGLGPAAGQEDAAGQQDATGQEDAAGREPASAQEDAAEQEDATGQDDDYLGGDVPEWLEDYGYEDTHDDAPAPKAANQGVSKGGSPGKGASASRKCDCIKCRNKLTGDWGGFRSSLQQEGIAYRGRVTQYGFGVGGAFSRRLRLRSPPRALGVATRSSTRETRVMTSSWT